MSLQIDDFSELNEEKNTHMKGFITGGTWKLKEYLYEMGQEDPKNETPSLPLKNAFGFTSAET